MPTITTIRPITTIPDTDNQQSRTTIEYNDINPNNNILTVNMQYQELTSTTTIKGPAIERSAAEGREDSKAAPSNSLPLPPREEAARLQ